MGEKSFDNKHLFKLVLSINHFSGFKCLLVHYALLNSYEVAPRSDSEESGSEFEEEVSVLFFSAH